MLADPNNGMSQFSKLTNGIVETPISVIESNFKWDKSQRLRTEKEENNNNNLIRIYMWMTERMIYFDDMFTTPIEKDKKKWNGPTIWVIAKRIHPIYKANILCIWLQMNV